MEENKEEYRNLIIDTNVIISSLVKTEGITRVAFLLLVNSPYNRCTCPETVIKEIKMHEAEIARRAHMEPKIVRVAIDNLLKNIRFVKEETFKEYILSGRKFVKDENDTPFASLALKNKPSFIVTYNEKHYKIKDLEKEGVIVVKPVKALKMLGFDSVNIKLKKKIKNGVFSSIANILFVKKKPN